MKKRRLNVPQMDWLCDVSGKSARVTSIGRNSLLVENHTGILELSDRRIQLGTRCGRITVEGERLSLSDVRLGMLAIHGIIHHVRLPESEDRK